MPSLGWQELVIVLIIVIIIFGAGKLPDIGGQLGKSIKEFKANTTEEGEELEAGKAAASSTIAQSAASEPAKSADSRQVRADEI